MSDYEPSIEALRARRNIKQCGIGEARRDMRREAIRDGIGRIRLSDKTDPMTSRERELLDLIEAVARLAGA